LSFAFASCGADNTVDDDVDKEDNSQGEEGDNGETEDGGKDEIEHVHSFGSDLEYDGNGHFYACVCGERRDVEPHRLAVGDPIEPTCYSFGYSSVEYCEVCGFVKKSGVEIKKLPHNYADGICTVCEIPEPSDGLKYELSEDGEYYAVVEVGTCKDDVIVIPEEYEGIAVKKIAANAFEMCVSIREIIISDSVTVIDEYAFSGCELLTNVTLGANVSQVGFGVFYGTAYYLNPKNWQDGVLYLDNVLVEVKNSGVSEVNVREGTSVIADHAFSRSTELVYVNISDDVKYIGKYAFRWCDALESVTVPDGVWYVSSANGDVAVELTDPVSAAEKFTQNYYYCNFYKEK
jgi:hypothetical protein